MQLKIDYLRRRLRRKRQRRTPSDSDPSFEDEEGGSYRPRSRISHSASFSYNKDCHYKWRSKSPPHKGLGNDVMSKALN